MISSAICYAFIGITPLVGLETSAGLLGVTILLVLGSPIGGCPIGWIDDEVVRAIVCISALVISWVYLSSNSAAVWVIGSVVYLLSLGMFISDSLFWMFVWFESSLVPIVAIIVLTGVQFERVSACLYMFIYTVLFGSAFLMVVFFNSGEIIGFSSVMLGSVLNDNSSIEGGVVGLLISVAFMIKVPLFLLHPWLPKAHLESGLEGSLLLAGVLLKMGVYGLIRLLKLFSLSVEANYCVLSIALVGTFYAAWLSLSSSDMKITVAYSSVIHINIALAAIITLSSESIYGVVISSVSHSIVSVLLFSYVTMLYDISGSRSYTVNKGIASVDSAVRWGTFVFWSLNMCLPPTLCFIGEIYLIVTLTSVFPISVVLVISGIFLLSCVCVLNCLLLQHSSNNLWLKNSAILWPIYSGGIWSACLVMLFFGVNMLNI